MSSENKVPWRPPLWLCVLVIVLLYILQGVTLGLTSVVSIYLTSLGATWKQLTILSFVMYPFSIKLLWAPLIDVFYIRWLGRRRTWLLPIQIILGLVFIILSYHLEFLLVQLHITKLTVIFFSIMFLTATYDICVDGWALTLFSSANVIWQSISQMTGQPLGGFLGSSILLTFESANMTNRLIRQPLGIVDQPYGLFTLAQFVRFWGVIFLITACFVAFVFREQQQNINLTEKETNDDHVNLSTAYLYIIRLFKKKIFRQLLIILIGPHVGYAANAAMTYVMLIRLGMITRETLGLITMPLILVKVIVPLLLWRTHQPLIVYAQLYIPRLLVCLLIAIFILFAPLLQPYPIVFYGLLIILLGLNDAFIYMQGAAMGGFFASISDTRIGSTYYTLVASLNNAGSFVSSSAVLYIANWLPKDDAFYIEVSACVLLGCVWLCASWKLIQRLQALPVDSWHVSLHKRQLNGNHYDDHQMVPVER